MNLLIAILGLLSSTLALVLAVGNSSTSKKPHSAPIDATLLLGLGRRIQMSMLAAAVAAASNVWLNSILVAVVWVVFFMLQFVNLRRTEFAQQALSGR